MFTKKGTFILSSIMALSLFCASLSAVKLTKEYSGSRVRGAVKSLATVERGCLTACWVLGLVGTLGSYDSGVNLIRLFANFARGAGEHEAARIIGEAADTVAFLKPSVVAFLMWKVLSSAYITRLIYRDACDEFEAASLEERQASLAAMENAVGESSWGEAEQTTADQWNN